jgi:hypothetical protein
MNSRGASAWLETHGRGNCFHNRSSRCSLSTSTYAATSFQRPPLKCRATASHYPLSPDGCDSVCRWKRVDTKRTCPQPRSNRSCYKQK